ncbi:hypothetical protein BofuT4_uP096010.1 [Botrytis cinerea T4]|uniref:Uncharacterized protein n=1 Tax=Botryotinia fuckeliana (strain T4) TaxID=999810 RepID=G2YDP5_BOTF4|nr:hypothetical protein BofuT4_uP096010.1 [Botrytis cinerea T4]
MLLPAFVTLKPCLDPTYNSAPDGSWKPREGSDIHSVLALSLLFSRTHFQ